MPDTITAILPYSYDCSFYRLIRFYRSRYNKFSECSGKEICEISENASKDYPTLLIVSLRVCNIDKRQSFLKIFQALSSLKSNVSPVESAQQVNSSISRHVKNKKRLAQCSIDLERKIRVLFMYKTNLNVLFVNKTNLNGH